MDFLKTALSPPDFSIGTFQGIPDSYDGRVVTKSFTSTQSMPILTDGLTTFIVQLPIPGIAYFYGQVNAGALLLKPVYYTDYTSLFPSSQETTNVTAFRYAGQAFEIIPLVNSMNWAGSVQVIRGQVELGLAATSPSAAGITLNGLTNLVNSVKPDAVHPFNMGCYCIARQTQHDFPFHQIYPATLSDEISIVGISGSTISTSMQASQPIVGCGSMEAIVYKLPSFTTANNNFTLRTWAFLEFQVNSTSSLYEYSHISPPLDAAALVLVKKAFNELMVCVPFYENDGFWEKVLRFIHRTSEALSYVPGPVGDVAYGVSTISEAISQLIV